MTQEEKVEVQETEEIMVENTEKCKKGKKKALRIAIISLIEVVVLFLGGIGGFFIARLTTPPANVTADYVSYEKLLEVYKPTTAEQNLSVTACGNNYYLLYKKAYYKLLTATEVYYYATGYTMSAGVKVNIDNRRYMQNGYFYIHTISKGTSSAFSGMTDSNSQAIFDIQNKMVKLREKGENAFAEMTEQEYIEDYGILQYAHSNYTITDKTILTGSSLEKDGNLNKLTLILNPTKSTKNLVVQMQTMTGSAVTYSGGGVTYTVWFDDDFVIRKTGVSESYTAKGMSCSAEVIDTYYYGGEQGFIQYPTELNYQDPQVRTEHISD